MIPHKMSSVTSPYHTLQHTTLPHPTITVHHWYLKNARFVTHLAWNYLLRIALINLKMRDSKQGDREQRSLCSGCRGEPDDRAPALQGRHDAGVPRVVRLQGQIRGAG